jgi:hypothetical protein
MWTLLTHGLDVVEASLSNGLWGTATFYVMADSYPYTGGFVEYAGGFPN